MSLSSFHFQVERTRGEESQAKEVGSELRRLGVPCAFFLCGARKSGTKQGGDKRQETK